MRPEPVDMDIAKSNVQSGKWKKVGELPDELTADLLRCAANADDFDGRWKTPILDAVESLALNKQTS